jgi:H+/Cl- antiporter ClcA
MPGVEDRELPSPLPDGSRRARIAFAVLGGTLGGLAGAALVLAVTVALKSGMDFVSAESTVEVIVIPFLGLALATLILHALGRTASPDSPRGSSWRAFPPDAVRADITGDVVDSAGEEERFAWRLAPLRAAAIFATVGLGAAMGMEAPAAYLGVATGASLGDRGRTWRRLLRPAALAAGAAGVSAVMGVAVVGTAYMLELGRRHRAPWSIERVLAAVIGGVIGWWLNNALGLHLIRLIVPKQPPESLLQAAKTALFIGVISGAVTAVAGSVIYRVKKWHASPIMRLVIGGLATAMTAVALVAVATPTAAVGPGGGAILWAEQAAPVPVTLLAVALLRAAATATATAAGGCGGIFVPMLAVGDISGRVFAPGLEIGNDLAGAAGAAAGIAGGYRLPLTAMAMSLGIGGPRQATLTCLITVAIASIIGAGAGSAIERVTTLPYLWKRRRA